MVARLRRDANSYIVGLRMKANLNRYGFTFRYWRFMAGSAD